MPPDWLNHLRQAQQCFANKQWDDAWKSSEQALVAKSDCAVAHQILGLISIEQGCVLEAMTHLLRALAIRPDLVPSHNALGRCHMLQGELEQAETCFNRVL